MNRVHFEEDKEKIQIIPEEYPGLPQEAEIQCLIYSFCVEGESVGAVRRSVPSTHVHHSGRGLSEARSPLRRELWVRGRVSTVDLKRLKEISLPSNFMEDLKTFSMSGRRGERL